MIFSPRKFNWLHLF